MKTEEKRSAIIDAAQIVFMQHGYDAASMAQVSALLGGSKQTLYSYFGSKAELFAAVILEKGAAQAATYFEAMHGNPDLKAGLTTFGRSLLSFLLSDHVISVRRMIVAEGSKSDLGRVFFEHGPKMGMTRLADEFAARMELGQLRQADPWRASLHMFGLLEAGPFQQRLAGAVQTVSEQDIEDAVRDAVDVFMRAYGPDAA